MASQVPETEVKTAPEPESPVAEEQAETFVETALKLGGKSEEEAACAPAAGSGNR